MCWLEKNKQSTIINITLNGVKILALRSAISFPQNTCNFIAYMIFDFCVHAIVF